MDAGSTIGLGFIGVGALTTFSTFMPASMAGSMPFLSGISPGIGLALGIGAIFLGMACMVAGKDLDALLGGGGGKGKPQVKRPSSPESQKPNLEKR
ncbi:MAG: hypothetical protein PHS02_00510 [Candidatus ainarchaeum sp.]|nr:hypothetical protein [Candidatus ainarchaeum sp.]